MFLSACLHINVGFLGGNANGYAVFPFLHSKRLCRVIGNATLAAEEWMDNGGRAGVCKIPKCLKSSTSKPTFGNIHDFQRLTLCCFPVFNWVTNIFILSALPYLLAAAAGLESTENLCFPSASLNVWKAYQSFIVDNRQESAPFTRSTLAFTNIWRMCASDGLSAGAWMKFCNSYSRNIPHSHTHMSEYASHLLLIITPFLKVVYFWIIQRFHLDQADKNNHIINRIRGSQPEKGCCFSDFRLKKAVFLKFYSSFNVFKVLFSSGSCRSTVKDRPWWTWCVSIWTCWRRTTMAWRLLTRTHRRSVSGVPPPQPVGRIRRIGKLLTQ